MEVGISGAGTQIEYWNFWNNIFNFYSFARSGYNTELSMEDNLSAFTKIFGEGASYIAEIIRIGEACLDGQVNITAAGLRPGGGGVIIRQVSDKAICIVDGRNALLVGEGVCQSCGAQAEKQQCKQGKETQFLHDTHRPFYIEWWCRIAARGGFHQYNESQWIILHANAQFLQFFSHYFS